MEAESVISRVVFGVKWRLSGFVAWHIEEQIDTYTDAIVHPVVGLFLAIVFMVASSYLEVSGYGLTASVIFGFSLAFLIFSILELYAGIVYLRYRFGTPVREWIELEEVRV